MSTSLCPVSCCGPTGYDTGIPPCQGPKGDPGDKGDKGDKGDQGDAGASYLFSDGPWTELVITGPDAGNAFTLDDFDRLGNRKIRMTGNIGNPGAGWSLGGMTPGLEGQMVLLWNDTKDTLGGSNCPVECFGNVGLPVVDGFLYTVVIASGAFSIFIYSTAVNRWVPFTT